MGTLWQDLKYGARSILRQPGFAAVVTLILALGIGANTAVFSYVSALFLAPLPVPAPDRMVRVFGSNPKAGNTDVFSYPDYLDLRDRNRVFDALAVHRHVTVSLNTSGDPENANGEMVSGNYFEMMGVQGLYDDGWMLSAVPIRPPCVLGSWPPHQFGPYQLPYFINPP